MTDHKTVQFSYQVVNNESAFSDEERLLIRKAEEICDNAYSPYSNFCVGAALLLSDGTIVSGSNQENAAYPSGLCAERVAFFHASSSYPNTKIVKVAITAKKSNSNTFIAVSPCGSCRQVMLEQEERQEEKIEIIFKNNGSWIKLNTVEQLLPFCFDKHNLQ